MEANEYEVDYSKVSINELVAECKECCDKDTYEMLYKELFKRFEPEVSSIVRKYSSFGEYEDLMQCGWLGLFIAVNRFDFTKEIKFSTFAYHQIRFSILKETDRFSAMTMSQGFKRLVLKVRHIVNEYAQNNSGKEPTDGEIKALLGRKRISLNTIALARYVQFDTLSLDAINDDSGDDRSLYEKQISSSDLLEENPILEEDGFINKYVFHSKLDEREIFVLVNKIGLNKEKKEYKTSELAKFMEISDSRVMQLYRRAVIKIKKHMLADGIEGPKG